MKLFLASAIHNTLPLLKTMLPNIGNNVLFIANAADMHADKWFVDIDRKAFIEQGYQLTEIDLRETSPEQLDNLMGKADTMHICGGSVYYLVSLLRDKGLDQVIKQAIRDEKIIYTGTSAGSIIVSKNIKPFSYDGEEAPYVKKVPDHTALEIIDFSIMPHINSTDFVEENKKVVENMPKDLEPLFFITDNQTIWIDNNCIQLLSI